MWTFFLKLVLLTFFFRLKDSKETMNTKKFQSLLTLFFTLCRLLFLLFSFYFIEVEYLFKYDSVNTSMIEPKQK